MKPKIKVGLGYDVHRLVEGRQLWLGGIRIPSRLGALGHSDADVLLHAICDAMLGALSLGDIGIHFSDTDQQFKNIDSKILLKRTFDLVRAKRWLVGNVDCALILQSPKIAEFVPQMRVVIAGILEIQEDEISIKATTAEQMGFAGEMKGIEAKAVCLLYQD
ncbi:MAG TPA: 2-C-methyl-D-erythritol 2,4-cyclodiphosphate synthase [Catalimonadaceae bacterium]|nr:2-C-methyl-D-erythritol 2,4-cyclodiphosphate synthase [Catalimonadaceae bacterium]HPI10209.1 2-C-methyl-D-erythritol 2,4-cyclodiphosphate synthase [Catalimonadaceae bacterium]